MFNRCINLTTLPKNFKLGENVERADHMFYETGLTGLPNNFSFGNSLIDAENMFGDNRRCYNLFT
jgi:hypothetical protein